jgi:hypothetical protein
MGLFGPSAEEQNKQATEEFKKRRQFTEDYQLNQGLMEITPEGKRKAVQLTAPQFEEKGRADLANALSQAQSRGPAQMNAAQLGQAATVQAGQIANQDIASSRQAQMRGLGALEGIALGGAPSIAEQSARNQGEKALAQQASLMASRGAGANVAGALASIGRAGQEAQTQLASDLALNRAQEQRQALGDFLVATGALRGQDIGLSQAQQQMGLQAGLANQGAQNQFALQQGLFQQQAGLANQDAIAQRYAQLNQLGLQGAGMLADLGQSQALSVYNTAMQNRDFAQNLLGMQLQAAGGKEGQAYQPIMNEAERGTRLLGAGIQAGGAIGGAVAAKSDKNSKKDIKPAKDADLQEFIKAAKAFEFKYKNPQDGSGKHIGNLAQELQKSEVGKSMVVDTPNGKVVDYGKGFGAMLATMNNMNQKIEKLEKKKNA